MGLIGPLPVVQAFEGYQTPDPQRAHKRAFQTAKVYKVGGCGRCLTCSGDCVRQKAGATQEWWPYGVHSPGLYLHLWGRQLARNICQASQRPATVWRPAADSPATPSVLLEKRSREPLMVHIPATYTNIQKGDTSVEFVTAVHVQRQSTAEPAQAGTPPPDPFLTWGATQGSSTRGCLCSSSSSSSSGGSLLSSSSRSASGGGGSLLSSSSSSSRSASGGGSSSPAPSTSSLPAGHFIARAVPGAAPADAGQRAGQLRWPGRAVLQEPAAQKMQPPLRPLNTAVQPSQQQQEQPLRVAAFPPRPLTMEARQWSSASSSTLTSPSDSDSAVGCIEVIELHPARARRSVDAGIGSAARASRGRPAEVPWLLSGLLKSARMLSPDSVLC